MAGTNSTTRMSQPRKKFSTEKTMATAKAEPALFTLTEGKMRASASTVTVSATRWRSVSMAR